jgi:hypothetical protein
VVLILCRNSNDENAVAIDQPFDNNIDLSASILNEQFTLDEVLRFIANLFVGKCCGIDGIPAEFFKTTLDAIAPIFLALFNHIFSTGNIPLPLRSSATTPVYKSGPSNIPGNNYRGISITNTMFKIFSGIINKRLYDWAEVNNKIDESHAGFRKGYSAVDNIFVDNQWFRSIYLKSVVVFIVSMSIFAKLLIELTITDYLFL